MQCVITVESEGKYLQNAVPKVEQSHFESLPFPTNQVLVQICHSTIFAMMIFIDCVIICLVAICLIKGPTLHSSKCEMTNFIPYS